MKIHIKVFITKSNQFRAVIQPEGGFKSEITVGGDRWKAGEFSEHHAAIYEKCRRLSAILQHNLTAAGGVPGEYWPNREQLRERIREFAVACYKRGFQSRHGAEVVKNWTDDPRDAVIGLVRDFLKKWGK